MTRKIKILLLLALAGTLLGGSTVNVPVSGRFIFLWSIRDGSTAADQVMSACDPGQLSAAASPERCMFPPHMSVRFREFGATVTEAFTTGAPEENCKFILRVGALSDDTGNEISTSTIIISDAVDNPVNTCKTLASRMDALGEQCTRVIDDGDADAALSAGGWWDIVVKDASGGTSCDGIQVANFFLMVEEE